MAFIDLVAEEHAGDAADLLAADRAQRGYLPNYGRAFAHRPEVYRAWRALVGAVAANMDQRRYELATLAAARRIRSSYCMLAHGKVLADRFLTEGEVESLARAEPAGGLDDVERAVMELADKVAGDGRPSHGRTSTGCARTGSPTPRSPTSSSPRRRAASSRRRSTASASSPTRPTSGSRRPSATPSPSAARLRPREDPGRRHRRRRLGVRRDRRAPLFFDHCALADYDPARPPRSPRRWTTTASPRTASTRRARRRPRPDPRDAAGRGPERGRSGLQRPRLRRLLRGGRDLPRHGDDALRAAPGQAVRADRRQARDYQFERARPGGEGPLALVGIGVEPGRPTCSPAMRPTSCSRRSTRSASATGRPRCRGLRLRADVLDLDDDRGVPHPPLVWERDRGWFTTEPFFKPELFDFPEGIGPVECVNVEREEVC